MAWTNEKLEAVKKIIGKHSTLKDALKDIDDTFGFSYDAVKRAFARNGYSTPSRYLLQDSKAEVDNSQLDKLLAVIKHRKRLTLRELCDRMDCGPNRLELLLKKARSLGYKFILDDDSFSLDKESEIDTSVANIAVPLPKRGKRRTIRLGIISDTHFGSKAALVEQVADFVNRAYDEYGVRDILHAGDITTGNSVYGDQIAELSHWGCQAQCEEAAKWLPCKKDLKYYAILGNHDINFIKKAGIDPGLVLHALRPDINIIGQLKKTLVLEDCGVSIELIHIKSTAHARSYALEKHVAKNVNKRSCPDIVLAGHLHTNGYWMLNGIHCLLLPCFEDANFFVKYFDFLPSTGGVILDIELNEDNQIIQIVPKFEMYNQKVEATVKI